MHGVTSSCIDLLFQFLYKRVKICTIYKTEVFVAINVSKKWSEVSELNLMGFDPTNFKLLWYHLPRLRISSKSDKALIIFALCAVNSRDWVGWIESCSNEKKSEEKQKQMKRRRRNDSRLRSTYLDSVPKMHLFLPGWGVHLLVNYLDVLDHVDVRVAVRSSRNWIVNHPPFL